MSDGRRLPPLPSLRDLTHHLRDLHASEAHRGQEYMRLVCLGDDRGGFHWIVSVGPQHEGHPVALLPTGGPAVFGWEIMPGALETEPFDAEGAAGRLLTAARRDLQ